MSTPQVSHVVSPRLYGVSGGLRLQTDARSQHDDLGQRPGITLSATRQKGLGGLGDFNA